MKRLTRWTPASFFRLSLAALMLLTLMLALSGLMLTASATSAADPLKPLPRPPTRTPTAQPTSTPTPYPTATTAPSPTATAMPKATATTKPTAAATSTALPDTSSDATGASSGEPQAAASLLPLLLWGMAAMIAALAIFGVFIWLFARRARRQGRQPAFASSTHTPSQERLNQLRQLLPTRKASLPTPGADKPKAAEPSIAGEDTSPPWSSPPGPPWPPPPTPPQWLIEAGFFKGSAEERSPGGSAEERSPEAPEKP